MVLDIRKLLQKAQYVGGFAFDYAPPKDKLLLPLCEFDGDVKVSGEYEIYEDGEVGVNLTLNYKLVGQCSYCLEKAEKQVKYDFEALFVTDKDDADNYLYDGVRVDLTKAVNDALLFSQPDVLLCKEGCKGIKIN